MSEELSLALDAESNKKRIARYDYYRTLSYQLRRTNKPKKTQQRKHALVVRRCFDQRGMFDGIVVDIKSPALCDVLLALNEDVEGINLSVDEPEATEDLLFHSYSGLVERLAQERTKLPQNEDLISDLTAAISLIMGDQGKKLQDVQKLVAQREITYELLWALLKPNSLVYQRHSPTEQDRVLMVRRVEYTRDKYKRPYLAIACDIIHKEGDSFGLAKQYFRVKRFTGARPITNLDLYPLGFHDRKNEIYSAAVNLGKRLVDMSLHSYHEITGHAMRDKPSLKDSRRDDSDSNDEEEKCEKFYTSGRVMTSPVAYHRFKPNSSFVPSIHRYLTREDMTDDYYAICSPILLGFSFDRKSWGGFAMSRITDVIWNDEAFGILVLAQKQRELIHALVKQHASENGSGFDDVIKGKGLGLIGLLAGPPGCGKTLTAEAVAEVTHRPLYTVSAGELGTTPDEVESRLLHILELTQMWRAVLLLDEAEVFLQQRNTTDLHRNALVSIFLRQLEYYQGIMILTTNMAEQCDRAFESRIHFSVNFPELDQAARKSIWKNFFNKAQLQIREADIDELSKTRLNGRQIKNVFSSAQTISLAKKSPTITLESIGTVMDVLRDWQTSTRHGMVGQGGDKLMDFGPF